MELNKQTTVTEKFYKELYHYGIKGMKWGVRRSKDELAKQLRANLIMREAITSGIVKTKINRESQSRHVLGKGYIQGRSYLKGDLEYAQRLIDELSGTGYAVKTHKGNWAHKEQVKSNKIIGVYIDPNGNASPTNKATIVYSKTGTHVIPRRGDK